MTFNEAAKRAASLLPADTVRLVSHLDADGISSSAILIDALSRKDMKFVHSTVKQLTEDVLARLQKESYKTYIFSDLGSGQADLISKYLKERKIFILDHHHFDKIPEGMVHLNPRDFGIGEDDISGSGVSYIFASHLSPNKKMLVPALIGAIGDMQSQGGFKGLNKSLEDEAIKEGLLEKKKAIRWHGLLSRTILYHLTYQKDPFIPGVTGDESMAAQFLADINLPIANKTYMELSDKEKKRLVAGIILKSKDQDIFGWHYLSKGLDLKEMATTLNACGRMGYASFGIGTLLGDESSTKRAEEVMVQYRKSIGNALSWYKENDHIRGKGCLIIDAEDNISSTIIGALASIISYEEEDVAIIAMADEGDKIKISARRAKGCNIDLRELLESLIKNIGGETGGHEEAAGAYINPEARTRFKELVLKHINILD